MRYSRGPRRNSGGEISRRYICGTGDNFSGVKSTPTCYEYSLNLPFSPFRTDVRPGAQLHRQIEFSDFWLVVHCTLRPNNKQTTMPSFKLHYIFYHLGRCVFVIGQISIAKKCNVSCCKGIILVEAPEHFLDMYTRLFFNSYIFVILNVLFVRMYQFSKLLLSQKSYIGL